MKKKIIYRISIIIFAVIIIICGLSSNFDTVHGASGVISHGVTGLTTSLSGGSGTSDSQTITIQATTTSSTSCGTTTYSAKTATLTLKNTSGSAKVLSFNYSLTANGGTGQIDGSSATGSGTFSKPLANNASITVSVTSSSSATNTTTMVLSNIELSGPESISATFKNPINGTYTVDGVSITADTQLEKLSTETYSVVATPNTRYEFVGWYINGALYSDSPTVSQFAVSETSIVEAIFDEYIDPLLRIATLSGASAGETIRDYANANSAAYHGTQHSWHTDTNVGGPKDSTLTTYFDDPVWSRSGNTYVSSTSGRATGDEASGAERSWTTVHIYSDIIYVQALQDCKISFKDTITGSNLTEKYFYTYVSSSVLSGNPTSTIKTDANKHESGSTVEISVAAGKYLYILSYGYEHGSSLASTRSVNYSYTSTITNFTITADNTRYSVDITFQDNTGITLASGKVKIGDEIKTIGTGGQPTTSYDNVGGSELILSINTLPTNYVFVGWKDVSNNNTMYYSSTYSFMLNSNKVIQAIFVPKMTITASGTNGYESATYQYKNTSNGNMTANGQYVARNSSATSYYSTLAQAFNSTDVVVLLASDTFNGNFAIPSGKTLVVPCGMLDQGPTTPAVSSGSASISYYSIISISGNWTINGNLVISAVQGYDVHGRPVGPVGRINMSDGSSMQVNGKLYAFGYLNGGSITTGSSAEVYELVSVGDMANAVQMYYIDQQLNSKKVFPFSNFFIRNIDAPVTYVTGSKLKVYLATQPSIAESHCQTTMQVIGSSNSMFLLNSGTMTKSYDREKDQTVISIDEDSNVATGYFTLSITLQAPMIGNQTVSIDTRNYYLPLCSGYRINVSGTFNINYFYKLLPGAMLDIESNGIVNISSGSEIVLYRMNDYNVTAGYKFSVQGCPVNSYRFPSSGTYNNHSAANTGSAQLNVDGTLNVSGGLYVTNDLADNGGSYPYSNGYNILTGTGKINLTSSQTSTSSIYEARFVPNSNDIEYTTVDVVSIKGLTVFDSSSDDGQTGYSSLSKNEWYGFINDSSVNVWSLVYIVSFNMKGHGESIDDVIVPRGRTMERPTDPQVDGYVFGGWYKENTCTNEWNFNTDTVNDNITLFASWLQLFGITFYDEDGVTLLKETTYYLPGTLAEEIVKPANPTKSSTIQYTYSFGGWYPAIANVTADAVYTATYSATPNSFTIIYNTHGGAHTGYDEVYYYSESSQNVNIGTNVLNSLPSRIDSSVGTASGSTLTIPANTYGDITVTWFWLINKPTADPNNPYTYNGLEQTYVVPSNAGYSVTNNTRTIVGSQNVRVTLNEGYNWSDDYNTQYIELQFTINPKALTVTANNNTITYGDAPSANGYTITGFVNGETESSSLSGTVTYTFDYEQYDDVGSYYMRPSGLSNKTNNNYSFSYVDGTLTVEQKELLISADAKTKTYGESDPALTYTSSGLVGSDLISGALTRVAGENVGTYEIGQGTLAAGSNYFISYTPANLTITAKTLNITADAKSKTYGESDPALTYTSSGLLGSDEISGALTRVAGENVGTYEIQQGTLTAGSNYSINYTSANLTITQKGLTITANNHTITYGDAPANNGVTYTGFVSSETESVLGGTLAYAYSYAQYDNVGNYTITPSGLTSSNYNITFTNGTLTVEQKEVGLSWTNTTLSYNGSAQKPTAQATGLVNNDEIGVTVTGEQTNVGNYTATASALTGTKAINYKLPSANTQSFSITAASLTITANNHTITYGDAPTNNGVTYSGFVNGETESVLGGTLAYAYSYAQYDNVGDYTITPSGLTSSNYNITFNNGTLTVNQKELVLSWGTDSFAYDGLQHIVQPSISGIVNNDDVAVSAITAQINAGDYTATAQLSGLKAGNYKLPSEFTHSFSITKASLTVTANNHTITYGDAPTNNGVTYSGFVNSETESVLGGALAYVYSYTQYGNVGDYTITPSGLTSSNYNITFNNGTLTVVQKELLISADAKTKTYGDADPALTYTSSGLVGSDLISGALTRVAGENVGTYEIGQGTLTAGSNYYISYTSANLTITAKTLNITADAKSKTYGESDPALTYTSSGLVGSDEISGALTRVAGENVGTYEIQQGTLTAGSNYSINYTSANLTINAKDLSINATDLTITYFDNIPTYTYTSSGLVGSDAINSVNLSCAYVKGSNVGNYNIVPSSLTLSSGLVSNYNVIYNNGILTVENADIYDVSIETNFNEIFTGSAITPNPSKSASSLNNQTISWSFSEDGTAYSTMPGKTNMGTYTIYYKVSAPNHNDYLGTFTFNICYQVSFNSGDHGNGTISSVLILTNTYTITGSFTADEHYHFVEWSVSGGSATVSGNNVSNINNNIVITAIWDIDRFTVTFTNTDGFGTVSPSSLTNVPYGSTISVSGNTLTIIDETVTATPLTNTAQYTYAFSEWQGVPVSMLVTDNITIVAAFTRTLNAYTVRLVVSEYGTINGETVVIINNINYGTKVYIDSNVLTLNTIDYTATPLDETAQYRYDFTSWSVDDEYTVVDNIAIYAVFNRTLKKYTVRWLNYNGTLLETDYNVPYGTVPTYDGSIPLKDSDQQYDYTFNTWTPLVEEITGNTNYTATFSSSLRLYTVTIVSNNYSFGKVNNQSDSIVISNVEYGSVITISENTLTLKTVNYTAVAASSDEQYNYTFTNWSSNNNDTINANLTITASFSQNLNYYHITLVYENETLSNIAYNLVDGFTLPNSSYAGFVGSHSSYTIKKWINGSEIENVGYSLTASDSGKTFTAFLGGYITISANTYYIEKTRSTYEAGLIKGLYQVKSQDGNSMNIYYFDLTDGHLVLNSEGIITFENKKYYINDSGYVDKCDELYGKVNNSTYDYYYFSDKNYAINSGRYYLELSNEYLPSGYYSFSNNTIQRNDTPSSYNHTIYISSSTAYIDGIKVPYGLFVHNNRYYYAKYDGTLINNNTILITPSKANNYQYYNFLCYFESSKLYNPFTEEDIVYEN